MPLSKPKPGFVALRPVRFDRDYAIGEYIPGGAVDPKRAAALEAMRLIVKDVATSTDNGLLPGPGDDEMMAFSAAAEPDAAAEPEPVKAATTRKRKAQQEEA